MLGYITYSLSMVIRNLKHNELRKYVFLFSEIVIFVFLFLHSFFNIRFLRLDLVCFCLLIAINMSGKSQIRDFNGRFILFLGKLSMPIYVWHYVVGTILNKFILSIYYKIILLYVITIVIAVLNIFIIDIFNRKKG